MVIKRHLKDRYPSQSLAERYLCKASIDERIIPRDLNSAAAPAFSLFNIFSMFLLNLPVSFMFWLVRFYCNKEIRAINSFQQVTRR